MFSVTLNDNANKKNKIKIEYTGPSDYHISIKSDSYISYFTIRDLPTNPQTGISFLLDKNTENVAEVEKVLKKIKKEKEVCEAKKKRNKIFRLNVNLTLIDFDVFKESLFFDLIKKNENHKSHHINNFEKIYKSRSPYNDKFSFDLSGSFSNYSYISTLVLAIKVLKDIQIHNEDSHDFFLFFQTLANKNFDFYFNELNIENIEKYLNDYDKSLFEKYILFYKV